MPMLFLGAGASAGLGLPTLAKLERKIVKHLEDATSNGVRLNDVYSIMIHERRKQGMRDDFEGVMAAARLWLAQGRVPFSLRMVLKAVQRKRNLTVRQLTEVLQRMVSEVERIIHTSLFIERSDTVVQHYTHIKRVFETVALELGCTAKPFHQIEEWRFDVFTTNWDTSLEILARALQIPISDGFVFDQQRDLAFQGIWSPLGEKLRVFKLHGSLDQFFLSSGKIVKAPIPPPDTQTKNRSSVGQERFSTLYGEKITGRAMLYPNSHQGPFMRSNPFKLLYERMNESLLTDSPLFIIGSSFGDFAILDAISRAKETNTLLRVGSVGGKVPDYALDLRVKEYGSRIESLKI